MAPSNTCLLGNYIIDFLDIARASHWIAHKQKFVSKALIVSSGRGTASALFDYVDREHGFHGSRTIAGREHVPLEQLMSDTFELLASDPRDKIYAILGLRDWPNGVPKLLEPDYIKSEADLFRDASRFALETPGEYGLSGLESLNTLEEDLRSTDLVSWAIFPSRAYDSSREPEVLNGGLFRCSGGREQLWSADPGTSSTIALEVLVVAGISLGEIEVVSPSLTQDIIGDFIALEHWLEAAITLFRAAKSPEIGTIASLLIAGTNFDEQLATHEDLASLDDFRWTLKHLKRVPGALDRNASSSGAHSSSTTRDSKAGRYFWAFKRACLNRKVFRTSEGYIGIGSNLLKERDKAAIIYGADLPFTLRPKNDDQYQLLATCYVLDAMFGEAVDRYQWRGGQSQRFHLL